MRIDKLRKLWLEVSRYAYIHVHELRDWDLILCKYDGLNNYSYSKHIGSVSPGERWGQTGDTGIFEKTVTIPENFRDLSVYLEIITGGEALVFINDIPYQGNDPNHYRVLLEDSASGGKTYRVKVESYVRRGQNEIGKALTDKACSGVFMQADLCAVDRKIQDFIWDLEFAIMLAEAHPEYQEAIEEVLSRIFTSFNIKDATSFRSYAVEGSKVLEEGLNNLPQYGSEYRLWMIGESHLDLAWLWRKDETYRKIVRTFTSALRNMERYEFFRFMMPQVKLYKMAKEVSEELFAQVRQRVWEGRWEIVGQLYVEPDTNLVTGESLVRQILYGRRFYKKEFGMVPTVESLIDAFGYSGNIPQILVKSGIDAVMVTKMRWYNDTNQFPYSAFIWKGIDGSAVLAATMPWFNRPCTPQEARANLEKNLQKNILKDVPVFYGWGDGGGGPDENHLEGLKRLMKWYKPAKVVSGSLSGYFAKINEIKDKLPVWWGEIYQEGHRGCYTSQALNKKLNRESQSLYRALEFLNGILVCLGGDNKYGSLEEGMELILVNQFHDILPGSSINEVYKDSWEDYQKVFDMGYSNLAYVMHEFNARIDLSGPGIPVILWNVDGSSRPSLVKIKWDGPVEGKLLDDQGREIPFIIEDGYLSFVASELPSFGYTVYRFIETEMLQPYVILQDRNRNWIENARYVVRWNRDGHLDSIYDKVHSREILEEGMLGNVLTIYFDYPLNSDAWDIDADYTEHACILNAERIEGPKEDPIKQWVTMYYSFGKSMISQDIVLYKGIERVEFNTRVNWHEKHKLLKANFHFSINSFKATYDIPFGVIERDTHHNNSHQKAQFEVPALSFVDISEGNYGVALMSPVKHGYAVKDNYIGLSLLRSPAFPDPQADQGEHLFTYSLFGHAGGFRDGEVIQESRNLTNPVIGWVGKHMGGSMTPRYSFLQIDKPNVVVEALKEAEDKDGLVLRLYETYGQRDRVQLRINLPVREVHETNLVEEFIGKPVFQNNLLYFDIKPFEIKTFKLFLD